MSVGGIGSSVTEVNGVPVVERGANSEVSKTQFLELLTVQLKYQDPLNPLDNTQMVEQQAMFAELEQMMNLNENFSTFVDAQEDLMAQLGQMLSTQQNVALLGNTVNYPSDKVTVTDGEPTNLYYSLTEDAMVGFTVKNEAGNIVRTVAPELVHEGKGMSINFDGEDDFHQTLPDGTYTIDFNVKNIAGEPLEGTGYAREVVSAIDFHQGTPLIKVASGTFIDPSMVMSVSKGGE